MSCRLKEGLTAQVGAGASFLGDHGALHPLHHGASEGGRGQLALSRLSPGASMVLATQRAL